MFKKWLCCQIGAREHYAVPRALHQSGRLVTLYTDFWAGGRGRERGRKQKEESRNIGLNFVPLRSLASRFHPDLGKTETGKLKAEVVSWNVRSLWWETILRHKAKNRYLGFAEVGQRFAVRVREALKAEMAKAERRQKSDWIFFAYDTGALEAMEWCHEQGIKCVLNQMDPNRVEVELVREEERRWPGWAAHQVHIPEEYFRRREREWALADRVVVNSNFCRDALIQQSIVPEKQVVIPLCYEREVGEVKVENKKQGTENGTQFQVSGFSFSVSRPLRVLFLGQVILRKGIQYLIAAARLLEKENSQFDVVGPIGISQNAIATAPGNVTFHGRATRDQAAKWYRQSDIFVLPTLSDGFAITQLEAMTYGLPVVATPCCGDVVSDGVDGFIVPPRDADALARALQRYILEPPLLKSQQTAALAKAKEFTLARLADNLALLEQSLSDR